MNADLVGAFNILKKVAKTITPSLEGLKAFQMRGNGGKTLPEGFEEPSSRVVLMRTPQTSPPIG
jgi:putative transposase